jgi:hypothetical protein
MIGRCLNKRQITISLVKMLLFKVPIWLDLVIIEKLRPMQKYGKEK